MDALVIHNVRREAEGVATTSGPAGWRPRPKRLKARQMQRVPESELRYDDAEGVYFLHDEPFSGVAYTAYPSGAPMSESEYRYGLFSGVSRVWWESGALEGESHFALNVLHGQARLWHPNGQLVEDEDYEYGVLVRSRKWDESGVLTEEFELSESAPAYQTLLRARQVYGNPNAEGS